MKFTAERLTDIKYIDKVILTPKTPIVFSIAPGGEGTGLEADVDNIMV